MSILVHLGYERPGLTRSTPNDLAHAVLGNRQNRAICGAEIGTYFDLLLFGTSTGRTLPSGTPKCPVCYDLAVEWGVR